MNYLRAFEIEALEERLEFTAPGFWAVLWDSVCWIAESTWDIMQSLWNTGSIGLSYDPVANKATFNCSFNHFFDTLGNQWNDTWTRYWNDAPIE